MNDIPIMWATELQSAYPKRSGPCGWGGMKLLLAVRRALQQVTWDELIEGVKRYANYCQLSGQEGGPYVLSPQSFFEQAIYLESLSFEAPKTKEEQERARLAGLASEHMQRTVECAIQAGSALRPHTHESATAYEHRLRIEQDDQRSVRRGDALGENIRNLASRLRVAK